MTDTQTPISYFKKYVENNKSSIASTSIRYMADTISDRSDSLLSFLKQNVQQPKYIYETSSVHSEYNDYSSLREFCSYDYDFLRTISNKIINHNYYTHIHSLESIARYDSDQLSATTKFSPARYMNSIKHMAKYNIVQHKKQQEEYVKKDHFVFPGVRYLSDNIVIFEMPPTQKHVDYVEAYRDSSGEDSLERSFYIPIPWQVYIAVFDPSNMRIVRVQMYFCDTPITDFTQQAYLPPLLNFYSSGELCRPIFAQMEDYEKYPRSVSGVIASAYDWIWNSGFNFDITETISEYIVSGKWRLFLENSILSKSDKDLSSKYLETIKCSTNRMEPTVVRNFFKLWQSVPLQDILKCQWISFCKNHTFFSYQYRIFHETNFQEVAEWTKDNFSLELTEDWDGDQPPFEGWDEDSHITYSSLLDSSQYYRWAADRLRNQKTTILDAYKQADDFSKNTLCRPNTMYDNFMQFISDHQSYLTHIIFS
jgi:hypothetical protein